MGDCDGCGQALAEFEIAFEERASGEIFCRGCASRHGEWSAEAAAAAVAPPLPAAVVAEAMQNRNDEGGRSDEDKFTIGTWNTGDLAAECLEQAAGILLPGGRSVIDVLVLPGRHGEDLLCRGLSCDATYIHAGVCV